MKKLYILARALWRDRSDRLKLYISRGDWLEGWPQESNNCCFWLKGEEASTCFIHKSGCFSCSLVCVGVQKKWVLTPVKECLSYRVDGLASKGEGQAGKEQKLPSSVSFMWVAVRRCAQDLGLVFLPQMTQSRKRLTGVPSCLGCSWFQMGSSWQLWLTIPVYKSWLFCHKFVGVSTSRVLQHHWSHWARSPLRQFLIPKIFFLLLLPGHVATTLCYAIAVSWLYSSFVPSLSWIYLCLGNEAESLRRLLPCVTGKLPRCGWAQLTLQRHVGQTQAVQAPRPCFSFVPLGQIGNLSFFFLSGL